MGTQDRVTYTTRQCVLLFLLLLLPHTLLNGRGTRDVDNRVIQGYTDFSSITTTMRRQFPWIKISRILYNNTTVETRLRIRVVRIKTRLSNGTSYKSQNGQKMVDLPSSLGKTVNTIFYRGLRLSTRNHLCYRDPLWETRHRIYLLGE